MCGADQSGDYPALAEGDVCVLYVDDNEDLAHALRPIISEAGFVWCGHLPRADDLLPYVERECPEVDVLVLDLDMPGRDPFDALTDVVSQRPDIKVVVFSGYVRRELVDRAIEAGAWGYVSKNDGEATLMSAIREVVAGRFALSPEAKAAVASD
jgi:two-component system response regulator DesR